MIKNLVHVYGGEQPNYLDMRFVLICLFFSIFPSIIVTKKFVSFHVSIKECDLEILVPKSKTGQHRKGHIEYN